MCAQHPSHVYTLSVRCYFRGRLSHVELCLVCPTESCKTTSKDLLMNTVSDLPINAYCVTDISWLCEVLTWVLHMAFNSRGKTTQTASRGSQQPSSSPIISFSVKLSPAKQSSIPPPPTTCPPLQWTGRWWVCYRLPFYCGSAVVPHDTGPGARKRQGEDATAHASCCPTRTTSPDA